MGLPPSLPTPHLSGNLPGVISAGEQRTLLFHHLPAQAQPTWLSTHPPGGRGRGGTSRRQSPERVGPLGQGKFSAGLPAGGPAPPSVAVPCNPTLGSPGRPTNRKAEAQIAAGCQHQQSGSLAHGGEASREQHWVTQEACDKRGEVAGGRGQAPREEAGAAWLPSTAAAPKAPAPDPR